MDVLTSETCWALNNEIIKQVTSSWSLFIQHTYTCVRVLTDKLNVPQLVKNFFAFVGTRWFITVFIIVRHKSLSWTRSIQSTPSILISLKSILILFSRQLLRLPGYLFSSGFSTQSLVCSTLLPMRSKFPSLLVILSLITQILLMWATELLLCVWFQSLDPDTQKFGHLY